MSEFRFSGWTQEVTFPAPFFFNERNKERKKIMETKVCSKCCVEKPIDEFYLVTTRSGGKMRRANCISCGNKKKDEYKKSKHGLVKFTYDNQMMNSKRRKHPMPTYSAEELEVWLFSQDLFHELYDNWVKSGYKKGLKPSCDRNDNNIGYYLNGLTLMTWDENHNNAAIDIRSGKLETIKQKPVVVIGLDGNISEYHSVCEASRITGFSHEHISYCCRINHKSKSGYEFYFATDYYK